MIDINTWRQIIERQVNQLEKVPGVSNVVRAGYVDDFPVFQIYAPPKARYAQKGYEIIKFDLNCKAVMDCHPLGNASNKPYPLKLSDIEIKDDHSIVIYFPRGFPTDSIGWGIFFESDIPMYSNFNCVNDSSFYKFTGDSLPHSWGAGTICIGAASDDTGRPMHELVINLKSYMLMEEKKLFTHLSNGGNNDGGFEPPLLHHMEQNYSILKSALDSWEKRTPSTQKLRRLGGGKTQQTTNLRRLGKK